MINHDRLFKRIISEFFLEFLDLFLPDVRSAIVPESIVLLDTEIFTDLTAGERHEADLVVRARLKEKDSFFLIHIESQAQHQEEFSQRMFSYFARIHEKHRLPVYPIVVFSYDRPRQPYPAFYRVGFTDFLVLEFHYRSIQLNQLKWRKYVRTENPVASALMAKMKISAKDRPRVKLECLRLLVTLKLDPARLGLIWEFVETYLDLTASEMRQYEAGMKELPPQESETIMESRMSWIEQTREEARQEVLEQMAILVTHLLEERIGALDIAMQERIRLLSTDQVRRLGEAAKDINGPADLKKWLANPT